MVTVPARPLEVKPRSKFRRERDAVHAFGIGNFAGDFSGVHVEHDDFRAARNEQAARGGIEREVVPAAFAAERDLFQQMIAGRAGAGLRGG